MVPSLLLALGLSLPAPQDPAAPDLVVFGRITTGAADGAPAEALAVRGSRVTAVGTRAEIEALRGAATRVLDAGDGSVVPGFNDAHCHFTVAYGLAGGLDLTPATSLEETLDLLRDWVDEHPDEEVIEGRGWDLADMPGFEYPTAAMIDEVVFDRPVLLWSEGPHAVWANSAALERAGIDAETPVPPATVFLRDDEGHPSGVFLGRGLFGLFRFSPFPDLEELKAGIRSGLVEAASLGVTSVHDPVSPMLIPYLAELHDAGELTLRFHIWGSPRSSPFGVGPDQVAEIEKEHGRESWITFGTLKSGVDGMPGLRTALMLEAYADDAATKGLASHDPARVAAEVALGNERGLRLAMHATGDAGVRMCVEAFAKSHAEHGVRNRVEHAFVVTPQDAQLCAASDVVLSVQPGFLSLDLAKNRFYDRYFGPERCRRVLPLRSLLDAGVVLAFGTDFSLTPLDPLFGLHAATTRTTVDGEPHGGWQPQERITLAEAIRAYTFGSAYAEGAEKEKGTLAPGMLADLVVYDRDLFALEPGELREAKVRVTIVDGRVVFER